MEIKITWLFIFTIRSAYKIMMLYNCGYNVDIDEEKEQSCQPNENVRIVSLELQIICW